MSHLGAKSDINITPLIDIVLVLLIVFIVLVPTLAKVSDAALPTQGPPPPEGSGVPLVLSLDAQGQPFLQQEALAWSEIQTRLVPPLLLQPHGARKVFLKVAGDLPHGTAVRAMDEIRAASDQAKSRTLGVSDGGGDAKVVLSLNKS